MPASFDSCRKAGGKTRTVKGPDKQLGLESGEFMPVCIKDGKVFPGYKKRNHLAKEMERAPKRRRAAKDEAY